MTVAMVLNWPKFIIKVDMHHQLLGEGWHVCVTNRIGDFSYVTLKTVWFHLLKRNPILDYGTKKKEDGTIILEPSYIAQPDCIVFFFCKG